MAHLFIPRVLPITMLIGGGLWLLGGVTGLIRRIQAITGDAVPADPLTRPNQLIFTAVGVAVALLVVSVAIRWLTYRVTVGPDGFHATILGRRTESITLDELKGVVLRQAGGVPQLRLVRREGEPLVYPGWSLRARYDDGELDDAGPALSQLGAQLGFRVKVLTILGRHGDKLPERRS